MSTDTVATGVPVQPKSPAAKMAALEMSVEDIGGIVETLDTKIEKLAASVSSMKGANTKLREEMVTKADLQEFFDRFKGQVVEKASALEVVAEPAAVPSAVQAQEPAKPVTPAQCFRKLLEKALEVKLEDRRTLLDEVGVAISAGAVDALQKVWKAHEKAVAEFTRWDFEHKLEELLDAAGPAGLEINTADLEQKLLENTVFSRGFPMVPVSALNQKSPSLFRRLWGFGRKK